MYFFFFKQKTAYEMRISDWSSDVCSSDLARHEFFNQAFTGCVLGWLVDNGIAGDDGRGDCGNRVVEWVVPRTDHQHHAERLVQQHRLLAEQGDRCRDLLRREHALRVAFEPVDPVDRAQHFGDQRIGAAFADRSEEHTSELQSLMRISYAV